MSKKKNPVVHLKQSDVKRIKEDATNTGLKYAILLFFTVMRDKEGYGIKRLKRILEETTRLADSIHKGYVKWEDLEKVLKEEADITFEPYDERTILRSENMKSANIKSLKPCPMCSVKNVFATYEENARYRYECKSCGQYFEFNAPSQLAADVIFNQVIAKDTN